MIIRYYFVIAISFLISALGILIVNQKSNSEEKNQNWIKFGTFTGLANLLFAVVIFVPTLFPFICALLTACGGYELIRLQKKDTRLDSDFFGKLMCIYILISLVFILFGTLHNRTVLYTIFVVTIFEVSCQLTKKIFKIIQTLPTFSPNQTIEKLAVSVFITIIMALLLGKIWLITFTDSLILAIGICIFAFTGNLATLWLKKSYNTKRINTTLPEYGGILDYFGSLISAGCFVYILFYMVKL